MKDTVKDDEMIDVKVEFSAGLLRYVCERLYPDKKITDKQIADVMTQMVVEALENTSKKAVKELEELWELKK